MPYTQGYILQYKNYEQETVVVKIWDKESFVDYDFETSLINLDGAERPLVIASIDNDEDKFTPIRGKEARIEVLTNSAVNLNTFSSGEDDRWIVEASLLDEFAVNERIIFKGFLVMDDISQPFLPDTEVLTLTATDNLGTLKDIPLTNNSGVNPNGYFKILDYVKWCLRKTGMNLPVNVMTNIHYQNDIGAYTNNLDQLYLWSKTFEAEIGESEDCYTVLEKICEAFEINLSQHRGEWYLVGLDTYRSGDYSGYSHGATKKIGRNENIFMSNDAALLTLSRPHKSAEQTYNYEYPQEIICNIDFSRGTFSSPLSGVGYQALMPECWTYKKGMPEITLDNNAYIKVEFNSFSGYEESRKLHMPQTPANDIYYLMSDERIPVSAVDKFTIGVDFKHSTDLGGGSGHFRLPQIQVRLYGVDNTYWTLYAAGGTGSSNPNPLWEQSNSTFTSNINYVGYEGESQFINFREWQNCSADSAPIPVDGLLEILLINNQNPHQQSKDFQNLRFEYIPFINGVYGRYKGHYHKFSQAGNYKAKKEEQVYISDGIRSLFKGALMTYNGTGYPIITNFYDYTLGSLGGFEINRFGKYRANALWNQYKNTNRIFQLTLQGLETNGIPPDLLHRYEITDANINTNGKMFICVGLEQDYNTCEWTGTFIEVINIPDYSYSDTHEFKYITE